MPLLSVEPNENITFKVHYQDDDLLVAQKRAGLPTQPGKGHEADTLLNGLFARFGPLLQNLGAARDFGLLHRLDKDTSGLLIVALRPRAYDALRKAFETRRISKFYWALCAKAPGKASGVIRLPIVETPGSRTSPKTAHVSHSGDRTGKAAVTAYRVLASSPQGALIEARPVTGRLHQIRVHLDAIGAPVLGDSLYGPRANRGATPRLALHAHRLVFTHPTTATAIDIHTPWPPDLRRSLARLGLPRPDLGAPSPMSHGAAIGDEPPDDDDA